MSVIEPPADDETRKAVEVDREVSNAEIPDAVPAPKVTGRPFKDVCRHCKRPVLQITESDNARPFLNLTNFPSGWAHFDGRIDQSYCVEYHVAELYEEPPTPWGFLNVKGKGQYEVNSGPSKVRSGWSGGGIA